MNENLGDKKRKRRIAINLTILGLDLIALGYLIYIIVRGLSN